MKLKYYLRGAGIGVIVTTLILLIAGLAAKEPERPAENAMAEARSLTIAEALKGTESSEKTEKEGEEASEKEEIPQAEPESETGEPFGRDPQEGSEAKPEEPAEEQVPAAEEKAEEESRSEEAEEKSPEEPVALKVFSVYHGDSPGQVSERLRKEGIVEDGEAFYEYLVSAGLNDYLEVGDFSIPEGASFEEIGRILTTNELAE